MFIIALLLGSILVPLQTQIESRNYENTQRILDQTREALLGYAAANGYFPCPASATSNGQESPPNLHTTTGACNPVVTGANAYIGFLPAAALGFTPTDAQGYAVDAWGQSLDRNRIRYAVSSATIGAANTFTRGQRGDNRHALRGYVQHCGCHHSALRLQQRRRRRRHDRGDQLRHGGSAHLERDSRDLVGRP